MTLQNEYMGQQDSVYNLPGGYVTSEAVYWTIEECL